MFLFKSNRFQILKMTCFQNPWLMMSHEAKSEMHAIWALRRPLDLLVVLNLWALPRFR